MSPFSLHVWLYSAVSTASTPPPYFFLYSGASNLHRRKLPTRQPKQTRLNIIQPSLFALCLPQHHCPLDRRYNDWQSGLKDHAYHHLHNLCHWPNHLQFRRAPKHLGRHAPRQSRFRNRWLSPARRPKHPHEQLVQSQLTLRNFLTNLSSPSVSVSASPKWAAPSTLSSQPQSQNITRKLKKRVLIWPSLAHFSSP